MRKESDIGTNVKVNLMKDSSGLSCLIDNLLASGKHFQPQWLYPTQQVEGQHGDKFRAFMSQIVVI
jgi:hypothetical protein